MEAAAQICLWLFGDDMGCLLRYLERMKIVADVSTYATVPRLTTVMLDLWLNYVEVLKLPVVV